MSEPKIPNEIYRKAAELLDKFPGVDFMNIVRLLVIGRESNAPQYHSLRLGLDEDPEQTTEIRSTKKPEPLKRRGRPRRRQITTTDGKTYAYCNARDMLIMNGIKDTDCIFPHNYSANDDYCKLEADHVFDVFHNAGIDLVEYICFDFNGKKRVFTFQKESEAANA